MISQMFQFIISLIFLCGGANLLVRGSGQIARSLGVSGLVVGLTVVSLGTSAPELFISVIAAMNGSAELAIGNVVGSNMANIGLVMALTAIVAKTLVEPAVMSRVMNRDFIVMLATTLVVFPIMKDLKVSREEGVFLVIILCWYVYKIVAGAPARQASRPSSRTPASGKLPGSLALVVLGVCFLTYGSFLLRQSVTYLAASMGVSELVIALTMVSIGTSLPELATSLTAALKAEKGLAIGNIVGSNIFNLTLVLGITSIAEPISVSPEIINKQYPAMLAITVLLMVLAKIHDVISRRDGLILVAFYLGIVSWILL